MKTYWLYYGKEVVSCTRLPEGVSDDAVRLDALEWHDKIPMCDRDRMETPGDRRRKIERSEVRA